MNTLKIKQLSPKEAWKRLPSSAWNKETAKHLLMRIGFSALPEAIQKSLNAGMGTTIRNSFADASVMEPPEQLKEIVEGYRTQRQRQQGLGEEERRAIRQALQKKSRETIVQLNINWLQHAADPKNSSFEKWGLFWENVFVVTAQKVKNPAMLYQYQLAIRSNSFKTFGQLAKVISKSPAMVNFLDLQQNKKGKPNENFARELFELFLLGEGNYTEEDIKEAARAFTGYRQVNGQFRFVQNQHDTGKKTVFGETGNWKGDDIIDLALKQPAARTFIPRELCKHYLSDEIIPDKYLIPLGEDWADNNFNLSWLASTFFSSQLFYSSQFRGNKIKSPFEFLLGLLQDLELDLPPLPRSVVPALRSMGQSYLNPPNVRGWAGGQHWINSATLIQRRQIVESFFNPPNVRRMNANEVRAMDEAKEMGKGRFFVTKEQGEEWIKLPPQKRLNNLVDAWLCNPLDPKIENSLLKFLEQKKSNPLSATRAVAITLLQSPEYQLA
ncbi:MAG: DUF1800 domain-containing protein [Verrucomicrobia bacterium]|nr:DUF1800 domain-containing protein [Verrucomicrobiota bacterium]